METADTLLMFYKKHKEKKAIVTKAKTSFWYLVSLIPHSKETHVSANELIE